MGASEVGKGMGERVSPIEVIPCCFLNKTCKRGNIYLEGETIRL